MIRFLDGAKRATDIARGPARERAPPRLTAKFDRIVAEGEKCCAGNPAFEPERAGKRGPKKRRVPENSLRRSMKRKRETLPFLHDLSVPSRTTRPNGIFG